MVAVEEAVSVWRMADKETVLRMNNDEVLCKIKSAEFV
jgi:hypothetical protein